MSGRAAGRKTRRERIAEREAQQALQLVSNVITMPDKHPLIHPVHLSPKNEKQQAFIDSIHDNEVTIGYGKAGTGKTFIATRVAAEYYRKGWVKKIYITRPLVGVGKSMGALPGDEKDKLKYLFAPMLEDLKKALGNHAYDYMINKNLIEFLPFEYIRGRSLGTDKDPVFIICDEAQNLTTEELISMVTRFGSGRLVLCGDPRQKDIHTSGLQWFVNHCDIYDLNVGRVRFETEDCVRSGWVRDLLKSLEDCGYYKD